MTETFVALLFAHVLADFVFQTRWMVENKRRPLAFLLHILIVLITAQAATGRWDAPELLALTAAHAAIDAVKTWAAPRGLAAFLADQGAHLATLAAAAQLAPGLFASGLWAGQPLVPHMMVLTAGLLIATRAGSFAVGFLMAAQAATTPESGLPRGGLTIGILERGLIFTLLLAGQPEAIGFLIAAKSILRFGTVSEDRSASEYVIIGTLASFGWAILATLATLALRDWLAPLEIGAMTP